MVAKYLYRKSDGVFLSGGFVDVQPPMIGDPPAPDFATYGVAEFGDADQPDPLLHRFDAALGKRLATPEELAAAADSATTQRAHATSQQKDILAMIAFVVRSKDPAAWAALTLAQKRAATLANADIWRDIRVFIEKNL